MQEIDTSLEYEPISPSQLHEIMVEHGVNSKVYKAVKIVYNKQQKEKKEHAAWIASLVEYEKKVQRILENQKFEATDLMQEQTQQQVNVLQQLEKQIQRKMKREEPAQQVNIQYLFDEDREQTIWNEQIIEQFKNMKYLPDKQKALNQLIQNRYYLQQTDKLANYSRYFIYTFARDVEQMFNDIKSIIQKNYDLQNGSNSVIVAMQDKVSGKLRHITIHGKFLQNIQIFQNRLANISKGNVTGSDPIYDDDYELITNNFEIIHLDSLLTFGTSDLMLFQTQPMSSRDHLCGYNSIIHFFPDLFIDEDIQESLNDVNTLNTFIMEYKLNIRVVNNCFKLNKSLDEICNDRRRPCIECDDSFCYKLYMEDIKNEFENGMNTIIYDPIKQHCEPLLDTQLQQIYINYAGEIYKQIYNKTKDDYKLKKIMTVSDVYKRLRTKIPYAMTRYIFFDFETIIDWSDENIMKPYSIAFLDFDLEQMKKFVETGVVGHDRIQCYTGFDCGARFINYIQEGQKSVYYKLISFNGANFDNHILVQQCLKYNPDLISNCFYNGSQLLSFNLSGRHQPFDLAKHLTGRLSKLCDSFKIGKYSKKTFDHMEAQYKYDHNMTEFENMCNDPELIEYNKYDVLSLCILYYKYSKSLDLDEAKIPLYSFPTIGNYIKKQFQADLKRTKINLPVIQDIKVYEKMLQYRVAGRVELFNGPCKIKEQVVSVDICSAYPYNALVAPNYFPCGEIVYFQNLSEVKEGKFFFVECDIDQTMIKGKLPMIMPKKVFNKNNDCLENNWGHNEILKNYFISSVMYNQLLKYGCVVKAYGGFYFTDKAKGFDLFNCLLKPMQNKVQQDIYKNEEDERYNPAVREASKLVMNALTGKVTEGLHTDITEEVNLSQYYSIAMNKNTTQINTIQKVGSKIFVNYQVSDESVLTRQNPVYLAIFIYDYTKCYIYDHVYSQVPLKQLLYTDTDSCKMRKSAFDIWYKKYGKTLLVPHWPEIEKIDESYKTHKLYETDTKIFGSYENELADDNNMNWFISKKNYACMGTKSQVIKFKGLNCDSILLNGDESFIYYDKFGQMQIDHTKDIDIYNYMTKDNKNTVGAQYEKVFDSLLSGEEISILCSSFRKCVKNSKRGISEGDENNYNVNMSTVQMTYVVKHLKIELATYIDE